MDGPARASIVNSSGAERATAPPLWSTTVRRLDAGPASGSGSASSTRGTRCSTSAWDGAAAVAECSSPAQGQASPPAALATSNLAPVRPSQDSH